MAEAVAILGASSKPDRYSFKAFKLLKQQGYTLYPVSPNLQSIEDTEVYDDLSQILQPIDTLTMYVGPAISTALKDKIIKLKPRRIIFNPGSENPEIEADLESAGIKIVHDCTLVMLNSRRF